MDFIELKQFFDKLNKIFPAIPCILKIDDPDSLYIEWNFKIKNSTVTLFHRFNYLDGGEMKDNHLEIILKNLRDDLLKEVRTYFNDDKLYFSFINNNYAK